MKATMSAVVLGVALGLAAPVAAQFGPPPPADPNAPTPRLANGHPDLTGSWQRVSGGLQGSGGDMFRRCTPFQTKNCMEWAILEAKAEGPEAVAELKYFRERYRLARRFAELAGSGAGRRRSWPRRRGSTRARSRPSKVGRRTRRTGLSKRSPPR